MRKINQADASNYLAVHYPAIKEEITKLSAHENFAGVLQAIINYLRLLLSRAQIKLISKHIKFVGWIYLNGNPPIKHLVENLFIRGLYGFRKRSKPIQWHFIFNHLPKPFKMIYCIQNAQNLIKI